MKQYADQLFFMDYENFKLISIVLFTFAQGNKMFSPEKNSKLNLYGIIRQYKNMKLASCKHQENIMEP